MNKELKELIEQCEKIAHQVKIFRYSNVGECYLATIIPNSDLKVEYTVYYEDDKWVMA